MLNLGKIAGWCSRTGVQMGGILSALLVCSTPFYYLEAQLIDADGA